MLGPADQVSSAHTGYANAGDLPKRQEGYGEGKEDREL